jgi:hypothetical protein
MSVFGWLNASLNIARAEQGGKNNCFGAILRAGGAGRGRALTQAPPTSPLRQNRLTCRAASSAQAWSAARGRAGR